MVGAVLALSACSTSPYNVSAMARPGADFSTFKTYGWVTPLGTDKEGYSTIITSYFKSSVQSQMAARGYVYSATNPDLLVNFATNVETRTEVYSSPSPSISMGYYGYRGGYGYGIGMPMYSNDVSTSHYKVGTVNVDILDAARKEIIWEGVLEGKLTKKSMDNPGAAIEQVIAQIFAKYPIPSNVPAAVK